MSRSQLVETHISTIFLVGDRAYKLKKPVVTGFLDYSTRARRASACRREVELNRRLSRDVYLGVADVIGEDGRVCDHLVVMRRMPADRSLAAIAAHRSAGAVEVREVARVMAAFHAGAVRSPSIARLGSGRAQLRNWNDSFAEMGPFVGPLLDIGVAAEIEQLARAYIRGRARLFATRVNRGLVVDGHGDLRADNVFCLDDGPRILDCVEFNDRLRAVDVLADIGFLAMDLERLRRPDLARRLLSAYEEFSGEVHPQSLQEHLLAYRAHVRAKVACIRNAQGDRSAAEEAEALMDITLSHLRRGRVRLVVVGGTPGTGKSSVAIGLAERPGWVVLRSDEVRKELAGLAPTAPSRSRFGSGIYSAGHTSATYRELLKRARALLGMGESVVLDASWRDARWRARAAAVATATSSELIELRCVLDAAAVRRRIQRRSRTGEPSDADEGIAAEMEATFDDWPGARTLSLSVNLLASTDVVYEGTAPTTKAATTSSLENFQNLQGGDAVDNSNMDPLSWLRNQLETADTDLLKEMVTTFANQLMSAEVDALCGAGYGERTRRPREQPQRLPGAGLGHPGRQRGPGDPQAADGDLLPGLAAGAAPASGAGDGGGGGRVLSARRQHPEGRGPGQDVGD
jgi:aminoglycoside phosphotransferase family enzyme/predicted kinase